MLRPCGIYCTVPCIEVRTPNQAVTDAVLLITIFCRHFSPLRFQRALMVPNHRSRNLHPERPATDHLLAGVAMRVVMRVVMQVLMHQRNRLGDLREHTPRHNPVNRLPRITIPRDLASGVACFIIYMQCCYFCGVCLLHCECAGLSLTYILLEKPVSRLSS